ncbi:hypothetical protein Pfo_003241 [Paulownia fortunei]|nr:hypothetical protein Pfo_003241 [Paulownia fortunei]
MMMYRIEEKLACELDVQVLQLKRDSFDGPVNGVPLVSAAGSAPASAAAVHAPPPPRRHHGGAHFLGLHAAPASRCCSQSRVKKYGSRNKRQMRFGSVWTITRSNRSESFV